MKINWKVIIFVIVVILFYWLSLDIYTRLINLDNVCYLTKDIIQLAYIKGTILFLACSGFLSAMFFGKEKKK